MLKRADSVWSKFIIQSGIAMLLLLFVSHIRKNCVSYISTLGMKHTLQNCSEWQGQQGKGSNPNECQQISFDTGGLLATAGTHGQPLGALVEAQHQSEELAGRR